MERLTKSDLVNGCPVCYPKSDSGLPELVMKSNPYRKIIEKLKEYEDLEEQGKLLKLPCAVGDTIYAIYSGNIKKYEVEEVSTYSIWVDNMYFDHTDIGKNIFLTKEEAEAALEEMSE